MVLLLHNISSKRHVQIADAAAVVAWAAQQPWCNGSVVMFGVSWSGFLAMQVAASDSPPAALAGVISVCATDSRFEDDMHYQGGALLCENLSWSSWLLHTLSQPPDPLAAGGDWRKQWESRAAGLAPRAPDWMAHPTDDAYWAHGSVKHRYDRISVPMLLLGGTHGGGYHNSVARMAVNCAKAPVTAVVGPWSHNMPHASPLGPQTGFLQDCVQWLQGLGAVHPPRDAPAGYAVFAEAPSPAPPLASAAATLHGRWLHFAGVEKAHEAVKEQLYRLQEGDTLQPAAEPLPAATRVIMVDGTLDNVADGSTVAGAAGGRWFTFGANDDMPTEQSADDAACACFELPPAAADVLILGRPTVSLAVADGATCTGHVVARLVAVAPNGVAHRITWGALHVGKAAAAGAPLELQMQYVCATLPKGYRLRLALSRDYFPLVWPDVRAAAKAPLPVRAGASVLRLPQAACSDAAVAAALDAGAERVSTDVHIPAGSDVTRTGRTAGRRAVTQTPGSFRVEVLGGESDVDFRSAAAGLKQRSVCNERFELVAEGGNVVPVHEVEWKTSGSRAGDAGAFDHECTLSVRMVGGTDALTLKHTLTLRSGGETVATREWEHSVDAATI